MQPLPVLGAIADGQPAGFASDARRHDVAAGAGLPELGVVPELVEDAALGEGHGAAELADVDGFGVEDEGVGVGDGREGAVVDADDGVVFVVGCHFFFLCLILLLLFAIGIL